MFEKLESFTKSVSSLPDRPSLGSAAELKAIFDAAPEEVRVYLNRLIDSLKKTEAGNSGAKNIGVTMIPNVTGNDIQTLLEKAIYVVESGINSLGEYVKYSDGRMECWITRIYEPSSAGAWTSKTVNGATYAYHYGEWVYPAAFLEGSKQNLQISGDIGGTAPESFQIVAKDHTKSSYDVGAYNTGIPGARLEIHLYARGKWK